MEERKVNLRLSYMIKERPECREVINQLLEQGHVLEEMIKGYYIEDGRKTFLTKGLRLQARKIFLEQQIK